MSNWTGTYTITTPGTTLTSATATTATNTVATWPTGAQSLANMHIRILSGAGAGQTVLIVSNTATVITVASWPGGIPNNTSTYEIVLIFENNDVLTANTTLSTNIITEISPNSTLLVNSGNSLTFSTSCTVRWGMSSSTMPIICANNRTTVGTRGYWSGISLASTLTITPNISYIKIQDANIPLTVTPSTAVGNASTIHHIWIESFGSFATRMTGAAQSSNMTLANIFAKSSSNNNSSFEFCATVNNFAGIFDTCWMENVAYGWVTWQSPGAQLQWITNSVFISSSQTTTVNTTATQEHRVSRCFVGGGVTEDGGDGTWAGSTTAAGDDGYRNLFCNVSLNGTFFSPQNPSAGNASISSNHSSSNDILAKVLSQYQAINCGANSGSVRTSDSDFLAGTNNASLENIDTSTSTTSTASPKQYTGLTITRTNPKSSRNYPLTINNISIGIPTTHSVVITFDSANGSSTAQQTTVNATSTAGQATLNVASTSFLLVGMVVEIGYGTARQEPPMRISTITAGVSITFETNLTFTHTAVQADIVAIQLRYPCLGFIAYGTASGNYTMQTAIPDVNDWGLYYTGIVTNYNGNPYSFLQTGQSITLNNLQPSTVYYFNCYGYSPLGELLVGTENTFTTLSSGGQKSLAYAT